MHVCVLQRIEGEKGIGKTNWDTHTIFERHTSTVPSFILKVSTMYFL